jgi:Tfp pilus assembly protein PilO
MTSIPGEGNMNIGLPKNLVKYTSSTTSPGSSRSGFEVILLIIVGILVFWFFVQPKQSELAALKGTLSTLNKQSEQLASNRKKLEALIEDLNNSKDDITRLDEALPLDARVTKVHILLETLIARSGLTSSSLSISPQGEQIVAGDTEVLENPYKAPRKLQKVDISMAVTGDFDQFMVFLRSLERSARIMDIASIDMQASGDNQLDFNLNLTTYYFYE